MSPRFALMSVGLMLAMAGNATAASADAVYARPGLLVAVKGATLNFTCMGQGSPTVVFEAGWGDWAPAWSIVQPKIAAWTRTCSYDRGGVGFSQADATPRTAIEDADELDAALHRGGIAGPYILVANGFGSFPARTFALRFTSELAGLVLVDGDSEDTEPPETVKVDRKRDLGAIAILRACEAAIIARKPLPTFASPRGHPASTCARVFFRGLPEATFSAELNAVLVSLTETKVGMYEALISEMEELPEDIAWLQAHQRSLGARPVRVLTTGQHGIGTAGGRPNLTPEWQAYESKLTKAQARWLALSSNAKQIFVTGSGMYVERDKPDAVVRAVRAVYSVSKTN